MNCERTIVLMLATGFGVGKVPAAGGTMGTLLGMALFYGVHSLGFLALALLTVAMTLFGIWLCGRAAELLGEHDPKQVVFDEITGIFLVLLFVPLDVVWWGAAFVLFRLFDITKVGPVGYVERTLEGGLGIMADDIVASLMAVVILMSMLWVLPVL